MTRPIEIKVGNRQAPQGHDYLCVSEDSTGTLQRMIKDAVRENDPGDALIITVDGWSPWLSDMFRTIFDDFGVHPGSTALATFKWNSISIPHAVRSRHGQKKNLPWTFIIDQFNVPQVYWESVNCMPPPPDQLEDLSNFVFRIGGWYCGRGAYRFDDSLPVILLFTPPTTISRRIVSDTLFEYLYKDPARDLPDMNEAGLAWLFLKLQNLLSDFNNVTGLVEKELNNAEADSRSHKIPVKLRARNIYKQVDRIYEMQQYASFQRRGLEKLAKIGTTTSNKHLKDDPLWDEMQDALDDLEQHTNFLDSLKDRFNALSDLEFNIENATQSENGRFLSILGTLFLPISFLASIWGISTIKFSPISYLYAAIPIFIVSALFTLLTPPLTAKWHQRVYDSNRSGAASTTSSAARAGCYTGSATPSYCLLGDDAPGSASVPRIAAASDAGKHGKPATKTGAPGMPPPPSRARNEQHTIRHVAARGGEGRSRQRSRRRAVDVDDFDDDEKSGFYRGR